MNRFDEIKNPAGKIMEQQLAKISGKAETQPVPTPAVMQEESKRVPNPKGRPKSDKPKSKRIGLVAEPDLYAQMEDAAEKLGISVAGFIRQAVLEKLKTMENEHFLR